MGGMLTGLVPVAAVDGDRLKPPHDDTVGLLGLIGTPGWVRLAC
jgi:hypothetical protein